MASLKELEARVPVSGNLVAGRYALHEVVGEGGFGEVWRVDDVQSGCVCALKFLCHDVDPRRVTLFKDEFALLTTVAHPHVNPVYDFGRDPQFGYYFTSALVTGVPILKAARGQPIVVIETLYLQALRALAYLHRQGIAHYDIKPANLLVERTADGVPRLRVIDFGLASVRPLTAPMGTPSYMAPEFFLDQPADQRADLYALGVVLYTCLTGYNPFRATTLEEAKDLHVHTVPDPPSLWDPTVPAYLDDIVLRLLAKDPADRYVNAAHALRDLCFISPHHHVAEDVGTAQAAVPVGTVLVGRESVKQQIRQWVADASSVVCSCAPVLVVEGALGMGKTALLHAVKYQAQLQGQTVLSVWGPQDHALDHFAVQLAELLARTDHPATVVLIDDVDQLCETTTLTALHRAIQTLLDRLSRNDASSSVRLCVSREQSVAQREFPTADVIVLAPFTAPDAEAYLDAVATIPTQQRVALAQQLTQRSGGCPAVMRHLLQALMQQGQLADASGVWDASQFEDLSIDLAAVDVPRVLLRGMERRAEAIPPLLRDLAQGVALWGEPVAMDAVHAVMGARPAMLAAALHDGWLVCDAKTQRVTVTEPLLAEVLIRTLSPAQRQAWHGRIAAYLQQVQADAFRTDYHLAESNDAEADAAFARWCESELCDGRIVRVMHAMQDRLASRPLPSDMRVSLQLRLAQLQLQADIFEDSQATLEQLLRECSGPAFAATRWMVVEQLAKTHIRCQRLNEAHDVVQSALNQADAGAPHVLRLRNTLARVHLLQGDLAAAEAMYQETRAAAFPLPAEVQRQIDNNELGYCWLLQGKTEQAVESLDRDCAVMEAAGSPPHSAQYHNYLGIALRQAGQWDRARLHYERGIAIARQAQDLRVLTALYNGYGALLADCREFDPAIVNLERALPLCYRSGDLLTAVTIRLNLGHLHLRQDNVVRAEAELKAAVGCAEGRAMQGYATDRLRCPLYQLLGELARRRKAWPEATALLDTAWVLAEANDLVDRRFGIQFTRAEVAHDQATWEVARQWLQEADHYPRTAAEETEYQRLKSALATVRSYCTCT